MFTAYVKFSEEDEFRSGTVTSMKNIRRAAPRTFGGIQPGSGVHLLTFHADEEVEPHLEPERASVEGQFSDKRISKYVRTDGRTFDLEVEV